MRSSRRQAISLLMLITFVMGLGAYGFNSKWLAHEFGHHREALTTSIDPDRGLHLYIQGDADPELLSDAEHKLLHAPGHFEPVPGFALNGHVDPPTRVFPMLPNVLALLPAELESPFRPPRSTSLI